MIFLIAVCALVNIVTFVLVFRLWWRFAAGAFVVNASASAFFWFAYYEQYYKYKDCIDALTNSSCITPDGGNVTAGGAIWSVFALFFSGLALVFFCVTIYRLCRPK